MDFNNKLESIAHELASQIPQLENLEVILLCGSVAKNIADKYSDIELKLIWKQEPSETDRRTVFKNIESKQLFTEYFEDFEWYHSFILDNNIKVDVSHCTFLTINKIIKEVLTNFDTSIDLQLFISSLIDSITLRGDIVQILDKIQNYPEQLSERCITVNLIFESWTLRNALLARKDLLALNHVIDETLLQIMRLLFALNKVFLRSSSFKWVDYQVKLLSIKPIDLTDKLNKIILSELDDQKLELIHKLILEVISLVSANQPRIDLHPAELALEYDR